MVNTMDSVAGVQMRSEWISRCLGLAALAFVYPIIVLASETETSLSELVLCVSCHGENGIATSDQWPHLAAQNSSYLAEQSIRYRDGLRYDPNGLMVPWVKNLSDETIWQIAEYYSRQPAAPATPAPPDEVEKGRQLAMGCTGCHKLDGSSINDIWPELAAQNAGYIILSMQYYQQGQRQDSAGLMESFAQDLSTEDVSNLAIYYASLQAGSRETDSP
jgi:cytochrome c553